MSKDRGYIEISESIRRIREINEGGHLNEDYSFTSTSTGAPSYKDQNSTEDDNSDAVPYTMQDELMANITQTAKTQFGADFSQSKTPMLYYPKDGDVVLSGTISDMNDAKFQFRFKDSTGSGCYVWVSPLQLTDETINKLSVINGVFKNWKKELSGVEDIKPMGFNNKQ
jgi:hypothetical protein